MVLLDWKITNDFGGGDTSALEVELPDSGYSAFIKWDGCCEIKRIHNKDHNSDSIDRIHICDVPQFIKILQSLEDFRLNNIEGAE